MIVQTEIEATIKDLYNVPENGKAEIINGEVMTFVPTGKRPNRAGFKICLSLYEYEMQTGLGVAVADNAGFSVNLPHRKSFSPDAAFYIGEDAGMRFFEGAPVFAAEVRSANDYGKQAEQNILAKIADYFTAGTLVVWDVDLLSDDVIKVYRAENPDEPIVYRRGESAEAEPAVPDWKMAVDDLFS